MNRREARADLFFCSNLIGKKGAGNLACEVSADGQKWKKKKWGRTVVFLVNTRAYLSYTEIAECTEFGRKNW